MDILVNKIILLFIVIIVIGIELQNLTYYYKT